MKEKQNMSNYTYNTGGFKGKLAGKTYDSLEAMRHCERLEAMRRAVPTEDEAAFDDLPADKIKNCSSARLQERAGKGRPRDERHRSADVF
jgi:hypothetical protein